MHGMKHRPIWPDRIPTFDSRSRLVSEDFVADGRIVAHIKFDPETGAKLSYTTGLVTHFYNVDGRLIRKEIRSENNDLLLTETYAPDGGDLHSFGDLPSKEVRSTYGNVIYSAWHCHGKRHRAGMRTPNSFDFTPRPALVKFNEFEGTREEQFYKDDVLADPKPKWPALRVIKGERVVKEAHYAENQLHADDGPAVWAKDDDAFLEAIALQGKLVSATLTAENSKTKLEYDSAGTLIRETTDVECADSDAATIMKQIMNNADTPPPVIVNSSIRDHRQKRNEESSNDKT